jgi:hypothetical protein
MLDASMSYLRQFAPAVLAAVRFAAGAGTDAGELLQAVEMLAELYATGARKVPSGAPTGFVPARWPATCTPRRNAKMSPPTGTTGNCVCCWR